MGSPTQNRQDQDASEEQSGPGVGVPPGADSPEPEGSDFAPEPVPKRSHQLPEDAPAPAVPDDE
jgi:hypothetical protein